MSEERRLVTVLFADVTGSTAMGEELDPEDMRALLGRYYGIAREVVAAHGGTLEKFIGDAVMAVFGMPTAHDDDAGRAAAAALALRDQVRDDPDLGERLPIRLGLSTGEVVAAMDTDRSDFLVTGDAVNLAARLQQGAGSWEIVCSDRMAQAAGPGFAFGLPTEVEARGKSTPLTVRRLEGVATAPSGPRLPFLGRDDDVAQLELTATRAFRERRPYLITITAPAGTGKTRLLEEFLARLPAGSPDARVVTAQCLPYGQRLTYLPLHTLLLQLLELPPSVQPEELRPAATAWLTALGDPTPERSADLLAATFGGGEGGDPIDRAELFATWRSAIELGAQARPLVVVVEDLHWSSDSLLDLIEVILQPRGDAPLLMIALARPELLDRRPTWGGGRRNYLSVALEPLDDLAISALVDFLLGAPPPEVVETIVARSGGNPFFAGELARTIRERAIPLDDRMAVQAVVASLPDTVHGAVLARLDLLPPGPRRLIQLGSIFGRSFTAGGVLALAPELASSVGPDVDHLLEHDLLRGGASDELVFRHILIREVGYQTMPRAERARLHAAAAAWLAGRAVGREEEDAELVAFHFREAVTLAGVAGIDLGPDFIPTAVAWLRRAAEAASAGAAYEEAGRHIRAAIEFAPREQLPDLWTDLGDIFGGGAQAADAYATAARLGREQARPPEFILRALSGQLMVLGRWSGSVGVEISREELNALLAEIKVARAGTTDRGLIGLSLVAESFLPLGELTGGQTMPSEAELEATRRPAEAAAAIAREIDDPDLLSAALDAQAASFLGQNPTLGLALTEERLAIEDRLPLTERVDLHNMLAWNHAALGDLEAVRRDVAFVLRDLAPNQAQALALSVASWHVWSLAMLGEWDEVSGMAEGAIRRWEDAGRISSGFTLHAFMAAADVGWARGDDRLAARATAVIIGIAEQFPPWHIFRRLEWYATPDPERLVTEILPDWEPFVTRLHLVERVVALAVDRGVRVPPEHLELLLLESQRRDQRLLAAQLLRARGVQTGSADDLRAALEAFRIFGGRPMIARLEIELGRLTGDAALIAVGTAGLDALGDVAQLSRVASAVR